MAGLRSRRLVSAAEHMENLGRRARKVREVERSLITYGVLPLVYKQRKNIGGFF